MEIALVAEGLEFAEGPVAMADGSILVTEIRGRRICRVRSDGSREMLAETGGGPNGAAIGPDGALWIANNGGSFSWHDMRDAWITASGTGRLYKARRPRPGLKLAFDL